jgi:glucokinase
VGQASKVVAALDFGGTKIAAAVADEHGRRLAETTVPTDPARGAQWNLRQGLDAARSLLDGRPPAAVGACTFGIPAAHGVVLAPAIAGWEELALGPELVTAFACEAVRLATDVKAAAMVEVRDGALAGHDPAIYLNLGTGLAVALVVDGRVVSGANGAAGEIGYNLRRFGDGRLEPIVSGLGLAAEAQRRTGRRLSAADVFAEEASDPQLAELVDEFVAELSFQLVNLAVAVDPSRIAVGGGMIRAWERVVVPLRAALDESVPFPPELVPAAFPFDAPLVGAIALAVEAAGAQLSERRNGT